MTTEIEIRNKKWVVMKGGMAHMVSDELGTKLQGQLATQGAHTFILLKEIGITINSAEIDGVYDADAYSDLVKIKQGMWKCEYNTWHKKKGECECKREMWKKMNENRRKREDEEANKPLTPEEKEFHKKQIAKIGDDLRELGVLKRYTGGSRMVLSRTALHKYKEKFGTEYAIPVGAEIIEDFNTQ